MVCSSSFKIIQEVPFEEGFLPSAMTMLGSDLFVGLTHMGENVQLKTQTESGNIIKYAYDGTELVSKGVAESFGAVLDLCANESQ